MCDLGYFSENVGLPRPLCSRVILDARDRQTSKDVRRIRREPPKLDRIGAPPSCSWGVPDTIEMCPFTHVLILLPDQTVWEILSKSVWKMWPLATGLSRSLKVIWTDTDRSATYDFLLIYRTNHGLISSYHFRGNGDFSLKSISTPVYLMPPAEGIPLSFGIGAFIDKKIELWRCRTEKELRRHLQPSGYSTRT